MRPQFQLVSNKVALLTLSVFLIAAYWLALPGPFLLDDYSNLPNAKVETWSISALIDASFSNSSGLLGRPVSALTFALNYLVTGENTIGFKGVNLGIHAANACLIFLLIYALANATAAHHTVSAFTPRQAALGVAFLWALHPLHMSSVMYIVQRMNLLSTFFMLASMLCHVYARLNYDIKKMPFWMLSIATITFGTMALFSKENGALLIVYVAVVEWSVLRQLGRRRAMTRRLRAAIIVSGSMLALIAIQPAISLVSNILQTYEFRNFSMKERLLTQPGIVLDYLTQTLAPRISQMGLYFDSVQVNRQLDASVVGALLLITLLGAVFIKSARTMPLLSLGVGLFLGSHLMESTFLPLEIKFEHRNYFGSIGIITALVYAIGASQLLLNRFGIGPTLGSTLLVVLGTALTAQTYMRSHTWKDELSLNMHEVQRAPDSKRASSALAISLSKAGRTDDAMAQVKSSISSHPEDTYAPIQLFQICALTSSRCDKELNGAQRALDVGMITVDTVFILNDLTANKRAGLIKGLSNIQQVSLILSATRNPHRLISERYEAILHHLLSEAYLEIDKHPDAIIAISKAASLDPSSIPILTRAAEITAGIGAIEDADHFVSLIASTSPGNAANSKRLKDIKIHLENRRKTQ